MSRVYVERRYWCQSALVLSASCRRYLHMLKRFLLLLLCVFKFEKLLSSGSRVKLARSICKTRVAIRCIRVLWSVAVFLGNEVWVKALSKSCLIEYQRKHQHLEHICCDWVDLHRSHQPHRVLSITCIVCCCRADYIWHLMCRTCTNSTPKSLWSQVTLCAARTKWLCLDV